MRRPSCGLIGRAVSSCLLAPRRGIAGIDYLAPSRIGCEGKYPLPWPAWYIRPWQHEASCLARRQEERLFLQVGRKPGWSLVKEA
jgi:hypothetical protein